MSDQGDKTCPLCAEEMDLTDQQLKPCKCGYQICVWCWHNLMNMAEKDDTEGRCPACRSPYDKEKIVGMAANCERLVAEMSIERRKSQKAKTKTSEGRKQLSNVRVIQRNLVYIVGLPLELADEDLLQHEEYFGQYGKVLKVSMSRTAAGVVQQFPNNTCSVYITYSNEEDAICCIQSVHGFVLDGRSLKACFGTTKYCHAWLRNVPCTNPDCLYLHEIGSQEDSFTKDEIISAYTRSRVQQITGTTNTMLQRAGSMLPPPSTSATSAQKPILKNISNNPTTTNKGSPPNASCSRSNGLPASASWGMRATNEAQTASSTLPNGPSKPKPQTAARTVAFSSVVTSPIRTSSFHTDIVKKSAWNDESQPPNGKVKQDFSNPAKHVTMECITDLPEASITNDNGVGMSVSNQSYSPISKLNGWDSISTADDVHSIDHSGQPCDSNRVDITAEAGGNDQVSNASSVGIDGRSSRTLSNCSLKNVPGNEELQQPQLDQCKEPLVSLGTDHIVVSEDINSVREQFHQRTGSQTHAAVNHTDIDDDIKSFDAQRLKDPEVASQTAYWLNSANFLNASNHSRSHSLQLKETLVSANLNSDPLYVDNRIGDRSPLLASTNSMLSNGHREKLICSSAVSGNNEANGNSALDVGESSIISNILSLNLDEFDESLNSPQNLARYFGENHKQPNSHRMTSPLSAQSNNQSRFSFARQEESRNETFEIDSSYSVSDMLQKNHPFAQDHTENRSLYLDKLGIGNAFTSNNFGDSGAFVSGASAFSLHKPPVSRGQISAPPGFSVPNRAAPPGFSSLERMDQTYGAISGNHMLDSSSLLRNSYHAQPTGNIGSVGDIEFMDPAILAVGKGRPQDGLNNSGLDIRSNFSQQLSAFENEARLQLLMQRSLSPQHNLRYTGDSFSSTNDPYGISSRLVDQSPVSNLSSLAQFSLQQPRNGLVSNGHWDGWKEVQAVNSLGMADILRNERVGYNKFYGSGYEDTKFRMPSSGDLYSRPFEM